MSGVWGNKLKISVFGESHSAAIGVVVDGVPAGLKINFDEIKVQMARRAPNGGEFSTPRTEADDVEILCGVMDGVAEGTPICAVIRNTNVKSKDYSQLRDVMRPSHADYGYKVKYDGFNDYRGGGASSGRLTAPLVFAGAIARQLLKNKGIQVVSHILSVADVKDRRFGTEITAEEISSLKSAVLPLLDKSKEDDIRKVIAKTITLTGDKKGYIDVMKLDNNAPFFLYQDEFVGDEKNRASHIVIQRVIKNLGKDYRYEDSKNVVPELQNRKKDNTILARKKC